MHTGAVVADDGFRHKGCSHTVGRCNIPYRIFKNLSPVSAFGQSAEQCADFALAAAADFMMMNFNRNALFFKKFAHLGADIVERVDRRNREITALNGRTMAAVGAVHILSVAPIAFFSFILEEAVIHCGAPADTVKNEKFRLGSEVSGIADAGAL